MGRSKRIWTLFLLVALLPPAVLAQSEEAPERRIDLKGVRDLRAQAESSTSLDDELRARILELYDEAIGSLEEAAADRAAAARHGREQAGIGRMVDALRTELDRPERDPQMDLPQTATVEQAEGALARERSRLAANRNALRDVERLSEERVGTRNEHSKRLGALDQQTEVLNDELRTAAQEGMNPDLQVAIRKSLLARKEMMIREAELLRAQLVMIDTRGALIPLQVDQAQRRIAHGEQLVGLLEVESQRLRRRDAEESLKRILETSGEVANLSDALGPLAAETEEFAKTLWGPEGVVVRSERTVGSLSLTRKHLSDLDRIVQLTRRKFEAFGYRGSLARWWPDVPTDFPEPGEVATALQKLDQRIPEVQHQLIRLEQQRSKARELSQEVFGALNDEADGEVSVELGQAARDLLGLRRDLLEELIQQYGRYSSQLTELQTVSRYFLAEIERVQDFLYDRILWVRSVPRPIVPQVDDITNALGWLVAPANWSEAWGTAWQRVRAFAIRTLVAVTLFVLLLMARSRIRRRMATWAHRVSNPETDSFRFTFGALVYTILLAAPLPLALYTGHRVLADADASTFVFATSRALLFLAMIAALLELSRQALAPNGLGRAHFDWKLRSGVTNSRGLLVAMATFLPLIFVSIQLGAAGMRMDSTDQMKLYNNSLGRVAFFLALLVVGSTLFSVFRPRKGERAIGDTRSIWSQRVYVYTYPLITLTTFVPAVLAAVGFYLTAYLLAYQMLRTLWLGLSVLILAGVLARWRATRSQADRDGEPTEAQLTADAQIRGLFQFVVVVVIAVGLYAVWVEAVPAFQMMKRVQIWPKIALLADPSAGLAASAPPTQPAEALPAASAPEGDAATRSPIPGMPLPTAGGDAQPADSSPLTLWKLFQALLAGVIAFALVKNVPGLIELTLRKRTILDAGARIALATLIRYTILILGATIAFGFLGISWSKIQWLAAALTFGLGFGLQEIVANFVSGLILLMERPVRVGDAVTIGNLQGRVNRIQIRATTITLWDRSEMIVPNKEFITTKLINWTLSDSERRIDIPFRVAFGTELQKVKDTVLAVARENANVLERPESQALVLDFGDDAIKFELRVFVDFGAGLVTRDQLNMGIDRAFREAGIQFALPKLRIEIPETGESSGGEEPRST